MPIRLPVLPLQWRVLKSTLRQSRPLVAAFLAVTVIGSACVVAGPLVFAAALDNLATASPAYTLALFGLFALSVALGRFLQDAKLVFTNHLEQDVRNLANKEVLAAILRASSSLFAQNNPARISALVHNLHLSNKVYIQMYLMVFLGGITDIALAFAAVGGFVSWYVALFVVVYGVLIVLITMRGNKVTTQYLQQAQAKANDGANLLGNIVANIVSIRVFQAQPWVAGLYDRFFQGAAQEWRTFFRVRTRYSALQALLLFVQYGSIFAVLYWLHGRAAQVSEMVMVSMILLQLNRPFEMIGTALRDVIVAKSMAEPLQDMLDAHAPQQRAAGEGLPMPAAAHLTVALRGLSFAYHDDRPLFVDLAADFAPGRVNFILGPSGAGKSTLMQILLRLRDGYTGSVTVAGVELAEIDQDDYLAAVGYVPQEPMMMNLSIRENVLMGRDFPDHAVRDALDAVRLSKKLASLPDGLDYAIGEGGQRLSGGERQRLAIARALIASPRVLLLDEASSGLDEETERSIFNALRARAADTTIIAITHRVGVIQCTDAVLTLSAAQAPEAAEAAR